MIKIYKFNSILRHCQNQNTMSSYSKECENSTSDAGCLTLTMDDHLKKILQCVNFKIIEDCSDDTHSWNCITKSDLAFQLKNTRDEMFLDLKSKLNASHLDLLLIGLIQKGDHHEVKLCFTEEATEKALANVGLYNESIYGTLKCKVVRIPRPWVNQGSDGKILQWQAPNQRPLRTVEAIVPIKLGGKQKQLQSLNPRNVKRCCASFRSSDLKSQLLIRRTVDVNLQACSLQDVEIQTTLNLPNKMWAQWEPQLKNEESLTDSENEILKESVVNSSKQIIEAVHYNCMLNTYENDYTQLTQTIESQLNKNSYVLDHVLNSYERNTGIICCHYWHPKSIDIIAVGYKTSARYSVVNHSDAVHSEYDADSYTAHNVIIWDCASKSPIMYLESPSEVNCIQYCPYNTDLIVGGCKSGQILLWQLSLAKLNSYDVKTDKPTLNNQQHLQNLVNTLNESKEHDRGDIPSIPPAVITPRCHTQAVTELHWLSRSTKINQFGVMKSINMDALQVLSVGEDGYLFVWDFLEPPPDLDTLSDGDAFPFSILHKVIQPVFKVAIVSCNVRAVITSSCVTSTSISTLLQEKPDIEFHTTKTPVSYDEPLQASYRGDLILFIGTVHGSVALIDFSTLEILEDQTVSEFNIETKSVIHDGPVASLAQSPFDPSIVLSVGGHTFAIWSHKYQNSPIFIQHVSLYLSSGSWSLFRQSMLYICSDSGILQVWDVLNEKSVLDTEQHLFPNAIKAMPYLLHSQQSNYLPLTDSRGTICFYSIPLSHLNVDKEEKISMECCFTKSLLQLKSIEGKEVEIDSKKKDRIEHVQAKKYKQKDKLLLSQEMESESIKKREHSEMVQLESQLQSCHIDVRRSAQCRLKLIDQLPESLLQLKNIDRGSLLKAHQPIVELEEQNLRKNLLYKRRVNQTNSELNLKDKANNQASAYFSDAPRKKRLYASAEKYFQDFKEAEKDFYHHN